jgi:hypothetical protein
MVVGDHRHAPEVLLPGKTQYTLYRKLGGPQGRSGRVRKISLPYQDFAENFPPPGFDPRTAQPVAIRYTDWSIPAPLRLVGKHNMPLHYYSIIFVILWAIQYSKWTFRK